MILLKWMAIHGVIRFTVYTIFETKEAAHMRCLFGLYIQVKIIPWGILWHLNLTVFETF